MKMRDAILEAVDPLFVEHGFGLVGVDALAAAAKITKRTLYKHFGSKAGLFLAWLEQRDRATRGALLAAVQKRAVLPRDQVLALFDILAFLARDPGFHGCPFSRALLELAEPLSAARAVAAQHKAALKDWFSDSIRVAGLDDIDERAEEVLMLYDGVLQRVAATRSPNAAHAAKRLLALRWPE